MSTNRSAPMRRVYNVLILVVALVAGVMLVGNGPTAHAATCGTTNLALNKVATSSSNENVGTPASAAVDGNTGTRWSSAAADPQWLQVDLGSAQTLCSVVLQWETASGKAYQIQTSNDAVTWTSVYSTTTGPGGTETLSVAGTGRYIRMYGTARNTGYGYSLWEFQVFGPAGGGSGGCPATNLALNKTATASSTRTRARPRRRGRRRGPRHPLVQRASDPQWLQVDLGGRRPSTSFTLNWEAASGRRSRSRSRQTAGPWHTIYSTTTGPVGVQTLDRHRTGRYIRMYGTARTPATATACGSSRSSAPAAPRARPADSRSRTNPNIAASSVQGPSTQRRDAPERPGRTPPRVVEHVQRPAVAQCRLRWRRDGNRVIAELGSRVRHRLPDGDVERRERTGRPVYSTTTGSGGIETAHVSGAGRYLRFYGTARATGYGYSL